MSQTSETVENILRLHRTHCTENNHRVIFLDVDGVIANTGNLLKKAVDNKVKLEREADMFVPSCLRVLKNLVTIMDAKVVISSSWRKLDETLHPLLLKLVEYEIPVMGITPSLKSGRRDYEIMNYIERHLISSSNVLVLDDSEMDLSIVHHRLFRVNGKYGLRRSDIPKAIAVFCGKETNRLIDRKRLSDMVEKLSTCDRLTRYHTFDARGAYESIVTARCIAIALSTYLPTSKDSRDNPICQPWLSYRNWSILSELYEFEE